mmetsp:Transcript_20038/g.28968  ORF Transcript_20038/g.28968 Transcript_20038/m.28968 type:complete len:163 (+) Transcript_20038:234-722(+)|eukprot:CAMPEP_0113950812 /NCGR_PEP_ID=MMETSP1339-20121228/82611_1 /TAXON_ID=94617 /ORGANISM="Fibrocapsa japonica" /LENGTH=162 /DNA_ID=CAMNT_0000958785 /DNA_START=152 /DNA_END=640 /DNA_ORIENTATION=- /assembly_acc=CAM_ASM_000762
MDFSRNSLMRSLGKVMRKNTIPHGFSLEQKQDSLSLWTCKLFGFEGDLGYDLNELQRRKGINHIELEFKFQPDFPASPPFVRVIYPRFVFHTGHVTIGGSICLQILTRSGWKPSHNIEALIIYVRSELVAGSGRIDFYHDYPYSEHEAESAFYRVAAQHGWH